MNALDDRRRREADATAKFCEGNACVDLDLGEDLAVDIVDLGRCRLGYMPSFPWSSVITMTGL